MVDNLHYDSPVLVFIWKSKFTIEFGNAGKNMSQISLCEIGRYEGMYEKSKM